MPKDMNRGGGSCHRRGKGSFIPSQGKEAKRQRRQAPTPYGTPIEVEEVAA